MKVVRGDEMKKLDRMAMDEFLIPSMILMENAGIAVCEEILKNIKENEEIVIVCGVGNNGGDGFVVARHLFHRGIPTKVCIIGAVEKFSQDAKMNYHILQKLNIPIHIIQKDLKKFVNILEKSHMIIDAIFGTGLSREIDCFTKKVIQTMNDLKKKVVSIDIPSGIGANDGKIYGEAIRANQTIVLELPKIGNLLYPGAEYTGELKIKKIGIPKDTFSKISLNVNLITKEIVKKILPIRKKDTYKGDYGKVYILAGSAGMTGAGILSCKAALRSGAGLLKIPISESLNTIMETKLVEGITIPLHEYKKGILGINDIVKIVKIIEESNVIAMGPGSGNNREIEELLRNILENTKKPIVLDADAINGLANRKEFIKLIEGHVVLTPHMGEMSRLIGLDIEYIKKHPIEVVLEYAVKWNVVIVLKGARTIVGNPKKEIYINRTGNPGMAKAGSGDVLTGIITGFISQGIDLFHAAIAAVYIHGRAGDLAAQKLGEYGMLASDMINEIPVAIKEVVGR
ncbi:NAD(P)H-hydrate dehydratase [Inediibacterium massiliense]|uniref:NAD(P)H-hydrate dehydratase n=1 Tax=Inediibacterium massiliense TaxID=1658111 RepID=UPI0006B4EAB3|nr:NAD(P)H-hydrate dehydratase [Inediibacterium massiliense]